MKLRISDDLALPLDAVTQTLLVVGKRGSGKSNTAARFVEQLYHAKLPFVVLDPTDTWWGLKADRDGGRGLDVYVFGGRKADLPLEAGGGALIAEVLCEHRLSIVLSVKHLSGRERSAFMVAFAQTLFQKWGGGPLHVVLEEAHELAPQMSGGRSGAQDGEAAMLGAFKRLWKLGRASGIGGTAVTQRPASLSKDITTQSEILVAHRTIGPQDVKAIGEWVKYHGEQLDILAELPSLPTGEAFVWAPEFPEGKPIGLKRTTVLLRETYDSASTPKVGEQRVEPKELAAVDLERLRTKMAATIEKAKADDPRELRKQIAAQNAELAKLRKSSIPAQGPSKDGAKQEVKILTDKDREVLGKLSDRIDALRAHLAEQETRLVERVRTATASAINTASMDMLSLLKGGGTQIEEAVRRVGVERVLGKLSAIQPQPQHPTTTATARPNPHARREAPAQASSRLARVVSPPSSNGDGALSRPQRRILNALAWAEQMGLPLQRREKVAFLADASPKSSAFVNNLGNLRGNGLIDYPQQGYVALTDAGRAAAVVDDELPQTSAELQESICAKLPGPQARIVKALTKVYPNALRRDALADLAEASATSSAFVNNLGSLRSLGLLDYPHQGMVAAEPTLFVEGR